MQKMRKIKKPLIYKGYFLHVEMQKIKEKCKKSFQEHLFAF